MEILLGIMLAIVLVGCIPPIMRWRRVRRRMEIKSKLAVVENLDEPLYIPPSERVTKWQPRAEVQRSRSTDDGLLGAAVLYHTTTIDNGPTHSPSCDSGSYDTGNSGCDSGGGGSSD